jgi:hypothetical protein
VIAFVKLHWDNERLGPMTESAIRLAHGDLEWTRISKYIYPPDDEIEGWSREGTVHVLRGTIRLTALGRSESFAAGDVFRFSGGDYVLRSESAEGAELVWVWVPPPRAVS